LTFSISPEWPGQPVVAIQIIIIIEKFNRTNIELTLACIF